MARSILKRLRAAQRAAEADMRSRSVHGKLAGALASEGYVGGYRDALADVEAMMSHGYPADTRGFWDEALQRELARPNPQSHDAGEGR